MFASLFYFLAIAFVLGQLLINVFLAVLTAVFTAVRMSVMALANGEEPEDGLLVEDEKLGIWSCKSVWFGPCSLPCSLSCYLSCVCWWRLLRMGSKSLRTDHPLRRGSQESFPPR